METNRNHDHSATRTSSVWCPKCFGFTNHQVDATHKTCCSCNERTDLRIK